MSKESKEEWGGEYMHNKSDYCPCCDKLLDNDSAVDVIPLNHLLTDEDVVLVKQYWKGMRRTINVETFRCEDCVDRSSTKDQTDTFLRDQLNEKREYWKRIINHRKLWKL